MGWIKGRNQRIEKTGWNGLRVEIRGLEKTENWIGWIKS